MNLLSLIIIALNLLSLNAVKFQHETILDHENKIQLKWSVLDRKIKFKLILIEIDLNKQYQQLGFGMSERGRFIDAEIIVFNIDTKLESINLEKLFLDSNGIVYYETNSSSYTFISNKILNDRVELEFDRVLDTDNSNDYKIEFGTVHLVYFISENKLRNFDQFKPELMHSTGMKQVQLIKSNCNNDVNLATSKTLDITNENIKLPAVDTTYWCKVYKLPEKFKQKHHITAFESVITNASKGIVHHMEVFHCMTDPRSNMKNYNGPCNSEAKPDGLVQCRKVIAAWAMGADRFVYPSNAGGVLGGENYSPYLVLEIHYDNAQLKANIIDSSGIRIYYESKLRTYDAGILEIGLEYNPKMVIPPQLKSFHLNGYCLGECTKASLKSPITLFASQLHTHLTGRRIWTSLIRHNEIIDIVNSDNHYDQMFQEIRLLPKPIQVKPGDALLTQCIYETMDRNSTTFGGYSIRDEMCVNYLHYYPLNELEVCKSSISDDVLETFFLKMKEYDLTPIDLKQNNIRENFDSIRWTPLTSSILGELYEIAPIAFSCNSSHGKHIRQAYTNNKNGVFDLIRLDDDNDIRILKQNYAPSIIDTTSDCD